MTDRSLAYRLALLALLLTTGCMHIYRDREPRTKLTVIWDCPAGHNECEEREIKLSKRLPSCESLRDDCGNDLGHWGYECRSMYPLGSRLAPRCESAEQSNREVKP